MAERRMFAKTIVRSDAFMDMPQSAQLLYFHLAMCGDDDGFINRPKSIMREIGSHDDDLKILFSKKFVIHFETGVVVIKHWKIHNYIAKDRYNETKYKEEKELLELDENNSYTTCIQPVYTCETQVRLGKVRIDKVKNIYGELKNVELTENEYNTLIEDYSESIAKSYIDKLSFYIPNRTSKPYKDHVAAIRSFLKRDNIQKAKKVPEKPHYDLDTHCPYCYANFNGTITLLPKTYDASYTCKCGASGKDIAEVIRNKGGMR